MKRIFFIVLFSTLPVLAIEKFKMFKSENANDYIIQLQSDQYREMRRYDLKDKHIKSIHVRYSNLEIQRKFSKGIEFSQKIYYVENQRLYTMLFKQVADLSGLKLVYLNSEPLRVWEYGACSDSPTSKNIADLKNINVESSSGGNSCVKLKDYAKGDVGQDIAKCVGRKFSEELEDSITLGLEQLPTCQISKKCSFNADSGIITLREDATDIEIKHELLHAATLGLRSQGGSSKTDSKQCIAQTESIVDKILNQCSGLEKKQNITVEFDKKLNKLCDGTEDYFGEYAQAVRIIQINTPTGSANPLMITDREFDQISVMSEDEKNKTLPVIYLSKIKTLCEEEKYSSLACRPEISSFCKNPPVDFCDRGTAPTSPISPATSPSPLSNTATVQTVIADNSAALQAGKTVGTMPPSSGSLMGSSAGMGSSAMVAPSPSLSNYVKSITPSSTSISQFASSALSVAKGLLPSSGGSGVRVLTGSQLPNIVSTPTGIKATDIQIGPMVASTSQSLAGMSSAVTGGAEKNSGSSVSGKSSGAARSGQGRTPAGLASGSGDGSGTDMSASVGGGSGAGGGSSKPTVAKTGGSGATAINQCQNQSSACYMREYFLKSKSESEINRVIRSYPQALRLMERDQYQIVVGPKTYGADSAKYIYKFENGRWILQKK